MQELINKVVKWGQDRGLDKVGHEAQARYTLKETAELLEAYADKDIDAINDAIGDILVTLIVGASNDLEMFIGFSEILCQSNTSRGNNDFFSCYIDLIDSIDRLLRDIRDGYLTRYNYAQVAQIIELIAVSDYCKSSLKDCLQLAYNEIKNRTGKLVNGQFVKDN